MSRNRQVSLSFLFLFFSVLVTAQTQYGTIPNPPDFETAISINDIPVDELGDYYHYIPSDQHWIGKKIENWGQFFGPGESVEIKFYYQKTLNSELVFENQVPFFKTEQWYFKIQFVGYFYVVAETENCKLITKYIRYENGSMCQYQKSNCTNSDSAPPLLEPIRVDFEPDPYGNIVQTIPYHIEKQNAQNAFVSVQLEKNTTDWKLKFWSSEVEILEFVELDNYHSGFDAQFSNDTLIVSFPNIGEIKTELETQEQLISVLNVQQ